MAAHGRGLPKQWSGWCDGCRHARSTDARHPCSKHQRARQAMVAQDGDGLAVPATEPPLAPPAIAMGVLAIEHCVMSAFRSFFLTAPGEGR